MSLFPILGASGAADQQQRRGEGHYDPAAWLSNNTSFRPHDVLEPQNPYGKYASQAEFLRAAERYLESSSEEEDGDDVHGATKAAAQQGTAAATAAMAPGAAVDAAGKALHGHNDRDSKPRHGRRSRSHSRSRDDNKRSSKRSSHKRRDRSAERSKKRKSRKRRKHRHNSSDSSSDSGSESYSDSDSSRGHGSSKARARAKAAKAEREKILRLERAAAAAGIAPHAAAATLASAKPILKGAAPQPGEVYYDTRGDMQNLVYDCLYGGNIASYHRTDPLGLAKGARAYRMLPGQVGAAAAQDDAAAVAPPAAGRYFGGKAVAAERSRRLRRVYLSAAAGEESVWSMGRSADGRRRDTAGGGDGAVGGGSAGAGPGGFGVVGEPQRQRRGWLLSRLDGPAVAAAVAAAPAGLGGPGGRMAVPLPTFLPVEDPAAAAAAALAAAEGGGGTAERRGGLGLSREAAAALAAAAAGGESAEEWVLRRTREFNVAVREAPGDVALWLRFAAFQDRVARTLSRRAAEVAGSAAEKKLAILQRALESHPGHPLLLRALMAASEPLLQPPALLERWQTLLRRPPVRGQPGLWREYLGRRRSAFGEASLGGMQKAYGSALHALASERALRARQQQPQQLPQDGPGATRSSDGGPGNSGQTAVSDLDRECVRLVLELLDLELGAGAAEVAVGRMQALLEFHCFAPGGLDQGAAAAAASGAGGGGTGGGFGGAGRLSPGALLRLFDNFWESGAPRVGEEGAAGWAKWYRQVNEVLWVAKSGSHADADTATANRQKQPSERKGGKGNDGDDEGGGDDPGVGGGGGGGGGWSGWMELPPLPSPPAPPLPPPPSSAAAGAVQGSDGGNGGKG
ncbi:hypothetical protein Agub_g14751, partial [Astrephomene gubernaculifera]